jgi:hypothetical protein
VLLCGGEYFLEAGSQCLFGHLTDDAAELTATGQDDHGRHARDAQAPGNVGVTHGIDLQELNPSGEFPGDLL